MIESIRSWLNARHRRRMREAFDRGYQWARHALDAGTFDADALLAYADCQFNSSPYEYEFDRGVVAAVDRLEKK